VKRFLRNVDWSSLRVRIVAGLGAVLLLLAAAWAWQGWCSDTGGLKDEQLARLEALAATAVIALDTDALAASARGEPPRAGAERELRDTIAELIEANGIDGHIRALVPRGAFLGRIEKAPETGLPDALSDVTASGAQVAYVPEMERALLEGKVSSGGPYHGEGGKVLSAFAPLSDSFGGTFGILRVDAVWRASLWKAALFLVGRIVFAALVGGAVLWAANALVGRALRPLALLEQAAGTLAMGNWAAASEIRTKTSELVVLASALEALRAGVAARMDEESRAARELQESKRVVEGNLASQSEVLSKLGGEVREPLARFTASLRALESLPLDGEARKRVAAALQGAYGLSRAVEHALQTARLESGGRAGAHQRFDLGELIERVAGPARMQASENGLAFRVVVPETLPTELMGDPGAIQEVLDELLENALAATSEGSVTLRVWRTASKDESIYLRFEVADTGSGIAPERSERVERALRERMEFARREGRGVGLARASELVHQHGGEMAFESRPGTGSRFWFFARFQAPAAQRVADAPEPPAALPGSRVHRLPRTNGKVQGAS
jgi:signal transduction histidine kinase